MLPTKEWIEKYEKVKELLVSPVHYGNLFSQNEVKGKKLFILPMGTVHFPTGNTISQTILAVPSMNISEKKKPFPS